MPAKTASKKRAAAHATTAAPKPARRAAKPPRADATPAAATPAELKLNPLVVIPSPLNPRRAMDRAGLDELAASIVANGLLQAILVRPTSMPDGPSVPGEDQWYEVICGARRLAAVDLALRDGRLPPGWRIPARIRGCSDSELVLLAATENLARADMHPLDEAAVFQAMRPHVKPADGQTVEFAVGRALGVSERTVFRRLALLRCAPEVQEALREKKITLALAQAFSLGAVERQREIFAEGAVADGGGENRFGEPLTADGIRYEMVEADDSLIPFEAAVFDPALYQGRVVDDPENEDRYFADRGEFERLQALALQQKADEIRGDWPWVEISAKSYVSDGYRVHGIDKSDPEAGAIVHVVHNKIEIAAPVLRAATVREREAAASRGQTAQPRRGGDDGGTQTGGRDQAPPKERPPLSGQQINRLHEIKTQALRRAVIARRTHDGRVPLALTCLGLLGAREVRDMGERSMHEHSYGDRVMPAGSLLIEQACLDYLLKTAALDLPDRFKRLDRSNGEAAAAWFGALMSLPADDLAELHARLIAERIGSWTSPDKPSPYYGGDPIGAQLGDSPLAVAIATYTGAAEDLAETWRVDKEWMAQYGKDRLFAMAGSQCRIQGANRLKKGELVDVVMEEPKGFWTVSLFPEARFQSEVEAAKVLDLTRTALPTPLPLVGGSSREEKSEPIAEEAAA